ncbi:adenylyl-sulfate kinase [Actibacterium lipolyticum]|uniref:adenylyl-sulfate kinase n=1 Tax=Actibacterium lipolyticum TaxID=1524263 RepID=UPI001F3B0CD7|nr:adenylyl-sulfate kinase [Actibacterium lipolyticum]
MRIDTIEAALRQSALSIKNAKDGGYWAAYGIAADNLRLGHIVIGDSVNPVPLTRHAWNDAAVDGNAALLNVEVVCSDLGKHRHRVENRTADIAGQRVPDWNAVTRREYDVFPNPDLRIDTANRSIESCVEQLVVAVKAL